MTSGNVRIAVVMACYNRRETTLRCLRSLKSQDVTSVDLSVYLLDDASPDGTAEAVAQEFPEVTIVKGTGSLFWGGGMRAAMLEASKSTFDFMLWLNDDVDLDDSAIRVLLDSHRQIPSEFEAAKQVIVGATRDPRGGRVSYSGFRRTSKWHPARLEQVQPQEKSITRCDTMNGNFVLVPAPLFQMLGPIDQAYVHQLGDIDYGYRVLKQGGQVWIAPSTIGACSPNIGIKAHRDPSRSFKDRLRALSSPHGLPFTAWRTFMQRHAGLLAMPILAATYAKAVLAPHSKTI